MPHSIRCFREILARTMSQENVEIVRRTIEAFNGDGVQATLQYLDPEVEWLAPPEWLEERLYKGHEGIRRLASQWSENIDGYRLDPERFIDADDAVVVLLFARGRIPGGAAPIEQKLGYVWEVRDRRGVRIQVYFSWEEALEAAGLEE
jgi:ketosteroid isomerase-like protein